MLFSYLAHSKSCREKRAERQQRIDNLPDIFRASCTAKDQYLLDLPVSQAVLRIREKQIQPTELLIAYGKQALKAHAATNCLTEVMISAAFAQSQDVNTTGPLAGIPVSIKDTVGVQGWDSSIGYSAWINKPIQRDSALIRLLRDAGAVPFVKTNVPITLLSFEANSDLFGRTTNPHNSAYSPGGSTGGEAALLAFGGSRIGIGTDVAGSVRIPAHYSGIYTIKASEGRFLKTGSGTSIPGQIGVPAVYSPMARTLDDLETFWKAIFSMKPWEYDHSCLKIPWQDVTFTAGKKLTWGVMWDDGVVTPSPACKRALQLVVDTLTTHGHQIVDIHPPSPYEGLKVAAQLLCADACKTATKPIRYGESNDPGVSQALTMFSLPSWLKRIYVWYLRWIRKDEIYAGLVETWHEKSIEEYFALIAQREDYRARWFKVWKDSDLETPELDFILTVPNALPAVPHGGMKEGFKACGYTFLFNLLDYAAGVMPITHVDRRFDELYVQKFKSRNAIEAGAYKMYDHNAMHGLPVGVQVVGKRLEEEKVLAGMKLIRDLLKEDKKEYDILPITIL